VPFRFPWSFAALLVLAPTLALAKPPPGKTAKIAPPAQRKNPGRSIGSPTEGKLLGGSHLQSSEYLRIVPAYSGGDVRWGVEPLVSLIDRAAKVVRKTFPDAVLSVGHLSKPGGGEVDRHASHESGRDADIGFYIKNHLGKPAYADHFVAFKDDGTAPSWPGAKFDDARNWALVAALVGDGHVRITHIFVATPLRQRLLAYAQRIGAPPNLRIRASELMAQPKGALPHDDHFHVRIACPGHMEGCIEQPTAHHKGRTHEPARAHAAQSPPPHKPAPAAPAPKPHPKESEESSLVPSLAPIVPGLDSAVIPVPLTIKKPIAPQPAPQPVPPAIDDPDGIFDVPR
jgi:penicillin-insensitive murein endopeptidase